MATLPPLVGHRVVYRALTSGMLVPLPTTALHGALARALWREACVAPARPACRGCPAQARCTYARLFEPLPMAGVPAVPGVTDEAPRPLALAPEPPFVPTSRSPRPIQLGEEIAFRVTLASGAHDTTPALVRALRRAGRRGLGHAGVPVRLDLEEVSSVGNDVDKEAGERAAVELLTPLRVKREGRIASSLDAQTLVSALVRRAQLVASAEGRRWEPGFDPVTLAAQIRVEGRLEVVAVSRYSNRQQRWMSWPGLMGTVQLSGPSLPTLWPLLRWGESAQIGKATSFGFGRYRLVGG